MLVYLSKLPKTIDQAQFEAKVRNICADSRINIANPNWLMICMYAESNLTLITNAIGAYGFIQFTKSTAIDMGTTVAQLQKMSWNEYMEVVRDYLIKRVKERGTPQSAYELYALIHFPVAFGKPDSYVLYSKGSQAYSGNSGLDKNKDGNVQWSEVKRFLDSKCPLFYDKKQLLQPETKTTSTASYLYQNYNWTEVAITGVMVVVAAGLWWFIPNIVSKNFKNRLKNGKAKK